MRIRTAPAIGGRRERDAREAPREGQPADAWYEVWIRLSDYAVIDGLTYAATRTSRCH
ncbi:hypothetical protein [Nocardia gipuzkoensis]